MTETPDTIRFETDASAEEMALGIPGSGSQVFMVAGARFPSYMSNAFTSCSRHEHPGLNSDTSSYRDLREALERSEDYVIRGPVALAPRRNPAHLQENPTLISHVY